MAQLIAGRRVAIETIPFEISFGAGAFDLRGLR